MVDRELEPKLRRLHRRKRAYLKALVAFVPCVLLAWLAAFVVGGESAASTTVALLSILGVGVIAFMGLRVMAARCPRCGETYFFRGVLPNVFATQCMHCRLPLPFPER